MNIYALFYAVLLEFENVKFCITRLNYI